MENTTFVRTGSLGGGVRAKRVGRASAVAWAALALSCSQAQETGVAADAVPQASGSSNWREVWTPVALPLPVVNTVKGVGGIYARADGYLYLSSDAGMFRAKQSSIAATPNDPSIWQD